MAMNDDDLKKLYRSLLDEQESKGEDCPDIDMLMHSFSKDMDEHTKLEIVDHISECSACRTKFEAIQLALRGARELADEWEGVSLSVENMRKLKDAAQKRIDEFEKPREPEERAGFKARIGSLLWPKPAFKYASVIAGLIVIVITAIIVLDVPQKFREDSLRGIKAEDIILISPKGKTEAPSAVFNWDPLPEAFEYQIKVVDEELTPVWTSDKTKNTRMPFPKDLLSILESGRPYYWKVIVLFREDTSEESNLQEFEIETH